MYCSSSIKDSRFTNVMNYSCCLFFIFLPLLHEQQVFWHSLREHTPRKGHSKSEKLCLQYQRLLSCCQQRYTSVFIQFWMYLQASSLDRVKEKQQRTQLEVSEIKFFRRAMPILLSPCLNSLKPRKKINPTELKGNRVSSGLARLYHSSLIYGHLSCLDSKV